MIVKHKQGVRRLSCDSWIVYLYNYSLEAVQLSVSNKNLNDPHYVGSKLNYTDQKKAITGVQTLLLEFL